MKNNKILTLIISSFFFVLILATAQNASANSSLSVADTLVQISRADFAAMTDDAQGLALVYNYVISDLVNIPQYPENPDPNIVYVSETEFYNLEYEKRLRVLRNPTEFVIYGN
jgi:hypothetical protein